MPKQWAQEAEFSRVLCTEVEVNQVQTLGALQTCCVNLSKLFKSPSLSFPICKVVTIILSAMRLHDEAAKKVSDTSLDLSKASSMPPCWEIF